VLTRTMNHDEYVSQAIITTAQAILDGNLGIIEGSVVMFRISHKAVPVWHEDKDFRIFGLISSDTDHLPTGTARQYWSPTALGREDKKIGDIEDKVRSYVLVACRNLLARFKAPHVQGNDIE
jgi:Protein of unknown function (DUF2489)